MLATEDYDALAGADRILRDQDSEFSDLISALEKRLLLMPLREVVAVLGGDVWTFVEEIVINEVSRDRLKIARIMN